jgi:DNA repair and recombination protein RAD52
MTFTDTTRAELAKPLNRSHVKPPAPGKYGDYIEGWRTIDEANRIFGFDGWTRETVQMNECSRELVELTGKNGPYKQWRVGYSAKVRVSAGGVVREGTGFGHGQGKPEALGDAIESAMKEAETDAMKRALMTFGNPFGLALYDKTQSNVGDPTIDDAQWAELV